MITMRSILASNTFFHSDGALRPDLVGDDQAKTIEPGPDTFMGDIDTASVEQVFDVEAGS